MVVTLGDVDVAACIESEFVRHVEGSVTSGAAVTRVPLLAGARDRGNTVSLQIKPPDPVITQLTEVQGPIGPHHEAVGVVRLICTISSDTGPQDRVNIT